MFWILLIVLLIIILFLGFIAKRHLYKHGKKCMKPRRRYIPQRMEYMPQYPRHRRITRPVVNFDLSDEEEAYYEDVPEEESSNYEENSDYDFEFVCDCGKKSCTCSVSDIMNMDINALYEKTAKRNAMRNTTLENMTNNIDDLEIEYTEESPEEKAKNDIKFSNTNMSVLDKDTSGLLGMTKASRRATREMSEQVLARSKMARSAKDNSVIYNDHGVKINYQLLGGRPSFDKESAYLVESTDEESSDFMKALTSRFKAHRINAAKGTNLSLHNDPQMPP